MAIRKVILLLLILAISSCKTVENGSNNKEDTMMKSSLSSRPEWADAAGSLKGTEDIKFVGRVSGAKSETDAVQMATNDAFAKLSNYFGVSVKSDFISSEQETDGNYTYSIGLRSKVTGSRITVKNYMITDSYIEKWNRSGNCVYDAFVMISVPDSEITRIRVEVEGAASWHVDCKSDEAIAKTKELMQVLNEKRGIKFKPAQVQAVSESEMDHALEKLQTAYYFSVQCKMDKTAEYSGEFYTNISTSAEMISLLDGKVVERWSADAKGGAFSKEDSITKGIHESFKKILDSIR